MRCFSNAILLIALLASPGIRSQEITYDFSGTINQIFVNENEVIPDLMIGTPFTGFATFESSGWSQKVGGVSVTINDVVLGFVGQQLHGEVIVIPGVLYRITVVAIAGGDIGDSTLSAVYFGPGLVDVDGSAGITEPFPDSVNVSEFDDNAFGIVGTYLPTGDYVDTWGQISEFVKRVQFELGDVNRDGSVDLLDVQPFVELLQDQTFQFEADINGDGFVNLLDVGPFVDLIQGG